MMDRNSVVPAGRLALLVCAIVGIVFTQGIDTAYDNLSSSQPGSGGVAFAASFDELPLLFLRDRGGESAGPRFSSLGEWPGDRPSATEGSTGLRVIMRQGGITFPVSRRASAVQALSIAPSRRPPGLRGLDVRALLWQTGDWAAESPPARSAPAPRADAAIHVDFVGAPHASPSEGAPAGTRVSLFRGPRAEWIKGAATYESVFYRNVWPGIDLELTGSGDSLKYTYHVAPGADPNLIRVRFPDAVSVGHAADGSLSVVTEAGTLTDKPPLAHQSYDGDQRQVDVAFEVRGRSVSFRLGDYDPNLPLVIDPAYLVYASYVGSRSVDRGLGLALAPDGGAIITGETGPDAYVAKLSPDGTALDYFVQFGGDGSDGGFDVVADSEGNAYVTGYTQGGSAFPAVRGPDLIYNGGPTDAFVLKLNPSGNEILYAGFVGGSGLDFAEGIAVDADGRAHVSGIAGSDEQSFPVTVGPDLTHNNAYDAFVARLKAVPDSRTVVDNYEYSGFVGGSGDDIGNFDGFFTAGQIALDAAGALYMSGMTTSTAATFPDGDGLGDLPGPDQSHNGEWDAYIVKLLPDGSGFAYAGYIGGSALDLGVGMAIDAAGHAYMTGSTSSTEDTFPAIVGPDLTHNGGFDGFVVKVSPTGDALLFSGFVGGDDDDQGLAIALGPEDSLYIAGRAESTEATLPVKGGPDLTHNGPHSGSPDALEADVLVARLRPDPSAPDPIDNYDFLGFIGGDGEDGSYWMAVDADGTAYLAGDTASGADTFPDGDGFGGLPGIHEYGGRQDGFIAKVAYTTGTPPTPRPSPTATASPTPEAWDVYFPDCYRP